MKTIKLELDEQTLERAQQLAASRQISLEELINEMLGQVCTSDNGQRNGSDSIIGMFADEPELVDQVLEMAMRDRERGWERQDGSVEGSGISCMTLVTGNQAHFQRIQNLGYPLRLDNWRS